MGKCNVHVWFVSFLVVVEFVVCELIIGVVAVSGGRFLGSGFVGGVGRTSVVVFCCGCVVLLGKRVIVKLVSWHACCSPGIRMFCRRSRWR